MFQKNDKKRINHFVNFFLSFSKTRRAYLVFYGQILQTLTKTWRDFFSRLNPNSTRFEPEPEKKFFSDPNPKKKFFPSRTRNRTRPDSKSSTRAIDILAKNRHFFELFIKFFFFFFQIFFLFITILYTEQEKVLLQKKCYFKKSITSEKVLFHFIILHLKQCRTNENGASKMQKFLLLWPPVLWYFCLFFNQKPFWGKFEH